MRKDFDRVALGALTETRGALMIFVRWVVMGRRHSEGVRVRRTKDRCIRGGVIDTPHDQNEQQDSRSRI